MKTETPIASAPLKAPQMPKLVSTCQGATVGFVEVSPKLATAWLKHNVKNRTLKEDTANGYARDMHAENWLVTHQGLAFNDRHELIDGQHRLEAIIRSGKTVWLMVTFGLRSALAHGGINARDVVDGGAPRTVANILELHHDMKRARQTAAVATMIGNICYPGRLRKATLPQILAILELYRPKIDEAFDRRGDLRVLWSAGLMAGIAFAAPVHPTEAQEFQARINSGASLDHNHPILQLRNFLISTDARMELKSGTLASRCAMAELVLQTIYLFMKDKRTSRLEHSTEGADYFRSKQSASVEKIRELFVLPQFYRGSPTGPKIPPPSAKELAYQQLRADMNIKPKEDEAPVEA